MGKFNDLSGKTINHVLVIKRLDNIGRRIMYLCKCHCGNAYETRGDSITTGNTRSCGCLLSHPTHGMTHTPVYSSYRCMLERCGNPKTQAFKDYGARGITICSRWLESFENFFQDMGDKPDDMTLERIDNNGNYEPSNCKWASRYEQSCNRRNSRNITYNGETLNHVQWAKKLGGGKTLITSRLLRGWSETKAVSTPIYTKHRYP